MNEKQKVSFIHSMKTKIVFMVIASVVLALAVISLICYPIIKQTSVNLTQNYMNSMATLVGETMERESEMTGESVVLEPEYLDILAGNVKVEGMDSSYAYIVSSDGTMLYHPTADKIGGSVENDAVKQLLSEMASGTRRETEVITYTFKGTNKYASFYIAHDMNYIVIVTADESEALSNVYSVLNRAILGLIVAIIISAAVAFVVSFILTKKIDIATELISKLSRLDLTKDERTVVAGQSKDETGIMIRSIETLREELTEVVSTLVYTSDSLAEVSTTLDSGSEQINDHMKQMETAVSEIANGATDQAGETHTAQESVVVMGDMINEANETVELLLQNTSNMNSANAQALNSIEHLEATNAVTNESVKKISEQTRVTNESVQKIKDVTTLITEIASQTSLLSLNASIEAARAGEAGRGFAVVAMEVQKLADQSSQSASEIDAIVKELMDQSNKTVAVMEDVQKAVKEQDTHVSATKNAFDSVSKEVKSSSEHISEIADKMKVLDEKRAAVIDVVQNLSAISEENAASSEEVSASVTEVTNNIETFKENTAQTDSLAKQLKEDVNKFKM